MLYRAMQDEYMAVFPAPPPPPPTIFMLVIYLLIAFIFQNIRTVVTLKFITVTIHQLIANGIRHEHFFLLATLFVGNVYYPGK